MFPLDLQIIFMQRYHLGKSKLKYLPLVEGLSNSYLFFQKHGGNTGWKVTETCWVEAESKQDHSSLMQRINSTVVLGATYSYRKALQEEWSPSHFASKATYKEYI